MPSADDADHPPYDVVGLVASAGGFAALTRILSDLPADLAAAVVVVQHLRGRTGMLCELLARGSRLPVGWIADGDVLVPARVHVCPPEVLLTVGPGGECALSPLDGAHRLRSIDFFLASLADGFGARALVVVLTGMGATPPTGRRRCAARAGGCSRRAWTPPQRPACPQR
jgi:two-component system chemotaxis response regulator CheB